MFIVILSILALFAGAGAMLYNRFVSDKDRQVIYPIAGVIIVLVGMFGIFSRSFIYVDGSETAHLERIYMATDLPAGKIIALDGQKGPQVKIFGPGFHFEPFINVLYDVEMADVIRVPEGSLGFITAKDGQPLREGQFIADPWPEEKFEQMLDAQYFLSTGNGQKGPQLTVLRPGVWRINRFLFSVEVVEATDIPTGHVGVVRSNVQTSMTCVDSNNVTVKKGCIGVWEEALRPGRYYLNPKAYVVTKIPTRAQTLSYKGGYTKRQIDLLVEENGKITQVEAEPKTIPVPDNATGGAINVRTEGWTVPIEMRSIMQINPENAPLAVASVGELGAIKNVVTAANRDCIRTIGGGKDSKVMAFIDSRGDISKKMLVCVSSVVNKYGVTMVDIPLGEPAIPPELLVASLREQLATQLQTAYEQEKLAQTERISVEKERAKADKQHILIAAEIDKMAANDRKVQLQREGEGEKLKLMEIAKGQQAQVNVLGQDRTMQMQMLKEILAIAAQNPDIIKIPHVQVINSGEGGGSLEGAAAILGSSNMTQMLNNTQQMSKDNK